MNQVERLLAMFPFTCTSCERVYNGGQRSTYNELICKGCDEVTQKQDNKEGLPVCPSCGGYIPNNTAPGAYPGAISRKDNETEICSDCGVMEAMAGWTTEEKGREVADLTAEVTDKLISNLPDIYVDIDSGTVLNGPIFKVSGVYSSLLEDEGDQGARLIAQLYGKEME